MSKLIKILPLFLCLCSWPLYAIEITFPDEELASETVLPVFDHKEVVKNRKVALKERLEVGIGFGLNMTEALYANKNFNLSAAYHFTETHGVYLNYFQLFSGISDMGKKLQSGEGLDNGAKFDPSLAPSLSSMLVADYQAIAYYGKLSITKDFIMNLHLYALLGGQYMLYTDGSTFGFNFGIGQKLYITKNIGIRMDLRFFGYMGVDPTANNNNNNMDPDVISAGQYKYSDFKEEFYFHSYLNLNAIFLF